MKKNNEESIMDIISKLRDIDYINPEDIPNIDLYMDQVTTFMDARLASCKRSDDDKILTKTMITMEKELTNNLTKDVVRRFRSSQEIFSEVTDEAESDYLSRFAYICMLSFDVYIKKQLIERIIDETLEDPGKK